MGRRGDKDLRLRLELAGVPESVSVVRSVIHTVARKTGLDRAMVDDLRTAVSEACNNVVLHAYPTDSGPLIFSLAVRDDVVEVVVRDRGCGIRLGSVRNRGLGMGMSLINMLADRAEFESDAARGTQVRMLFRRPVPVAETLSRFSVGAWSLEASGSSAALPGR